MTLDEWEAGYLEACGTAIREAIQRAVNTFPEVAEYLAAQGCTCVMVLDEGCVNIGLDTDFRWQPETAEEAAFFHELEIGLDALGTMTLVNAMADNSLDVYEGCYIEFPLIEA